MEDFIEKYSKWFPYLEKYKLKEQMRKDLISVTHTNKNRVLTKREIRNELFGILAMCDAFTEHGSMVGGERKDEMIKYLPKQIAARIMSLQDLISECKLHT